MILIAYDGSASADRAIAVAAELLAGGEARLVHVWQPLAGVEASLPVPGVGLAAGVLPPPDEIERDKDRARGLLDAGVRFARAMGFDAQGELVHGNGSPAHALESEVDRLRPELIVIGSRGLNGFKAFLEGSVSRHVGTHAHAPVLIVPSGPDA
jgi:nucleotide-binding universal stress UspA family protein